MAILLLSMDALHGGLGSGGSHKQEMMSLEPAGKPLVSRVISPEPERDTGPFNLVACRMQSSDSGNVTQYIASHIRTQRYL